jgi:hypothetical protein
MLKGSSNSSIEFNIQHCVGRLFAAGAARTVRAPTPHSICARFAFEARHDVHRDESRARAAPRPRVGDDLDAGRLEAEVCTVLWRLRPAIVKGIAENANAEVKVQGALVSWLMVRPGFCRARSSSRPMTRNAPLAVHVPNAAG